METVKSLRVVLVSPSDVAEERAIVQSAIDTAKYRASRRGVTFHLLRWEDVGPAYHPEGPQSLIESRLEIADCDILIGIFWKRFGEVVEHPYSRTAREIRAALDARRANATRPDIAVYFCQRPYFPNLPEETVQQLRVLEFKSELKLEELILYRDYVDIKDFSLQVFEDLMDCLDKVTGADAPPDLRLSAHVTARPVLLRSESLLSSWVISISRFLGYRLRGLAT
jgi:hypothetical protein